MDSYKTTIEGILAAKYLAMLNYGCKNTILIIH